MRSFEPMVRLILTAILLALLTACGTVGLEPSSQLVQRAIAIALEQTQQQLSQQRRESERTHLPPRFEINRAVITKQEPLVIQNLPAYHVQGTYDFTLKLPRRQVKQQHSRFDIYLQRQQEGKTWRLALPQSTGKDSKPVWFTYLIP